MKTGIRSNFDMLRPYEQAVADYQSRHEQASSELRSAQTQLSTLTDLRSLLEELGEDADAALDDLLIEAEDSGAGVNA